MTAFAKLTKTAEKWKGTSFERVALTLQKDIYEALVKFQEDYAESYYEVGEEYPSLDEIIIILLESHKNLVKWRIENAQKTNTGAK